VPESTAHDAAVLQIYLLLVEWAAKQPTKVRIARNLAVRWLETHPQSGIDPDLCVMDPPPPGTDRDLSSLCLWKPGHVAPRFCVEVVSANHPYKDYVEIVERYASMGAPELLVFDPLLQGPRSLGGPVPLQLWRRDATGTFERVHYGDQPVHSNALDAWLIAQPPRLVIAHDRAGSRPWLTETERERAEKERAILDWERERAEKERERAEKERERAEKEREQAARIELERRLADLEAKLK
jgi:hypothetical protein